MNILTGDKDRRVATQIDDHLNEIVVRPAYRPDPSEPTSTWLDVVVTGVLLALGCTVLFFAIHALLPELK